MVRSDLQPCTFVLSKVSWHLVESSSSWHRRQEYLGTEEPQSFQKTVRHITAPQKGTDQPDVAGVIALNAQYGHIATRAERTARTPLSTMPKTTESVLRKL